MARKGKQKAQKADPKPVRYLFYALSVLLVSLTIYYLNAYYTGQISLDAANANSSITLSMFFSVIVFSYLLLRGWNIKTIISKLGLSRERLSKQAFWVGLLLFGVILLLELATGIFSQVTGIQLPTNVAEVLGSEPLYLLIFAVVVSPINEEILFRGFLVPRFGIILSAIFFALLHSGYASISEFAAALVFGLAAGYMYKKYGSLYSTIFAHMLVNLLAIAALIAMGSGMMP